jgi:SAM-dependent methyltransferase
MGHLYNTKVRKVTWFIRRFGFKELWMKPFRILLAPIIISRLPQDKFNFRKKPLPYFYHSYNATWANERCVEAPIADALLESHSPEEILEVGNVLSHYHPVMHQVVDKFEKGERVVNEDILSFQPGQKYALVFSISTFEHIGFDDENAGSSALKISEAISACKRLLKPEGRLVITVPIGYNPELDEMIRSNQLGASREDYLIRTGKRRWEERPKSEAMQSRYGSPFPYANAILVAEFARGP